MAATVTKEAARAARVAAVKCSGCGIGLGQGTALYTASGGTYECAAKLKAGACA